MDERIINKKRVYPVHGRRVEAAKKKKKTFLTLPRIVSCEEWKVTSLQILATSSSYGRKGETNLKKMT